MKYNTEDYFTLKDVIEETIRNGELIEFVNQRGSQQGKSSQGLDPKGKQKVQDTIYVIIAIDD